MTNDAPDNAYTELGRFVEAFELMIFALRSACIIILSNPAPKWQALIRIPFHHSSMTAKPLIDIFTSIVGTMLHDTDTVAAWKLNEQELTAFKGVLRQVGADCEKLASKRNNLLHGTWFIGLNPDPTDLSRFFVEKSTTTGAGLKPIESIPKDIVELKILTKECQSLREWILLLTGIVGFGRPSITTLFKQNQTNKRWERVILSP